MKQWGHLVVPNGSMILTDILNDNRESLSLPKPGRVIACSIINNNRLALPQSAIVCVQLNYNFNKETPFVSLARSPYPYIIKANDQWWYMGRAIPIPFESLNHPSHLLKGFDLQIVRHSIHSNAPNWMNEWWIGRKKIWRTPCCDNSPCHVP